MYESVQEVPKNLCLESKIGEKFHYYSLEMLLWWGSPHDLVDLRFFTNLYDQVFLLPVGFPTQAEYYNPALKTTPVRADRQKVPPTPEIIVFLQKAVFVERGCFGRCSFHPPARVRSISCVQKRYPLCQALFN